jgi:hypothetical protein
VYAGKASTSHACSTPATMRMAVPRTCWSFEVLLAVCILAGVTIVAAALLPPARHQAQGGGMCFASQELDASNM